MSGARVVALVPMRHHSARVPGKNYRPLAGAPLFHYIVRTLLSCPSVDEIAIDTDSPTIRASAAQAFPQVRLLDRPEHLRADEIPMTDVLAHDAAQVPADVYLQTHSTNPFLRAETIERALAAWRADRARHDSLFTVTRLQARLWDHHGRPINHRLTQLLQTQTLAPVFLENSCLYLFPSALIRAGRRIGERPTLFELDPLEAIDIDEERDFALAERLMASLKQPVEA